MNLADINWYLVLYVLFSLSLVIVGTNTLHSTGTGRALIYAIGSILVLVFFGFRWFSLNASASKLWPPTVNMCPDYLTFVPKITGSTSANGGGCVDLLGMTSKSAGLVKTNRSELANIRFTDSNKVFEYTAADVTAARQNTATLQLICNRCQIAGLTWEGVYDGDSCQGITRSNISQDSCPN